MEQDKKGGKKGKEPFSLMSLQFDTIDRETAHRHILFLIFAVVAAKILIMFVTTAVFQSFIDYFDFSVSRNCIVVSLR